MVTSRTYFVGSSSFASAGGMRSFVSNLLIWLGSNRPAIHSREAKLYRFGSTAGLKYDLAVFVAHTTRASPLDLRSPRGPAVATAPV